jgi:hypothetical protein
MGGYDLCGGGARLGRDACAVCDDFYERLQEGLIRT